MWESRGQKWHLTAVIAPMDEASHYTQTQREEPQHPMSRACWRNLTFVQHCIYLYFSVCVCWPVWPAARGSRFSLAGHTDWRSECSPLIQWCWPRHDPAPPPRGPSSPPAYAWSTHPHTIRGITVIYYEHVTLIYLKSRAYDTSM